MATMNVRTPQFVVTLNMRYTPEMKAALDRLAKQEHRTRTDLIRIFLEEGIAKYTKKAE